MKIKLMPHNNMNWLAIFGLWLKDNFYFFIGLPIAFCISYLYELKDEAITGKIRKGKVFNALLCAILTYPTYLVLDNILDYFNWEHSQAIAVVTGAFLGSLGSDKTKEYLLRVLETIFSVFGKLK